MLSNAPISAVIADDHPAILGGIEFTLRDLPLIQIAGTARNSTEIVHLLSTRRCDLLIADFVMPGGEYDDGLDMLSYLRTHFPDLQIIVFTALGGTALASELRKAGVKAIVSKADDASHLLLAVYSVLANAEYFSPGFAELQIKNGIVRRNFGLTKCELEVLRLFISGLTVSEIASRLNRTRQTISAQKIRAMQKIGVERDADLYQIVYECRRGFNDIF